MLKKSARYELFTSEKRGSGDVESQLQALLAQMQTPDNLHKLIDVVSKGKQDKPAMRKMDFSKFEEKLNKAKAEAFRDAGR